MAHSLNPEDLKNKLSAGESVFLKLWKPGCGACKLSEPAIERLEKKYGDSYTFVQIDAEEHPEMLELSGKEVLPAFFLFKDKKKIGEQLGFKGLAKLEALFKSE